MIDIEQIISFDRMKARYQKWKLDTMYYWYLLSCDLGIFKYNLPETVDPVYLELYLNREGAVGIKKRLDGTFLVGSISRDGELNQYGLGDKCIITTRNGEDAEGTLDGESGIVGVDAVIIYNNPLKTPEIDVFIDAVAMADCQQSAGINVKLARVAPAWKIDNSVQETKINEMFDGLMDGQMKSIVSGNRYDADIKGLDIPDLEPIDITQPERIQYVQYLSRYQDDIMRRHFSRRGLAMRTATKAAQQSDSEINGMDSVSWYYILQKLDERKKGIERFNVLWPSDAGSVEFSEIWENEYNAYIIRALKKDQMQESEVQKDENNGPETASSITA